VSEGRHRREDSDDEVDPNADLADAGPEDQDSGDKGRWHGLNDNDFTQRDMSYSPASDTETRELQHEPGESPATDDVEQSRVRNLPGTGGPDDTGDVIPPDEELDEPL